MYLAAQGDLDGAAESLDLAVREDPDFCLAVLHDPLVSPHSDLHEIAASRLLKITEALRQQHLRLRELLDAIAADLSPASDFPDLESQRCALRDRWQELDETEPKPSEGTSLSQLLVEMSEHVTQAEALQRETSRWAELRPELALRYGLEEFCEEQGAEVYSIEEREAVVQRVGMWSRKVWSVRVDDKGQITVKRL